MCRPVSAPSARPRLAGVASLALSLLCARGAGAQAGFEEAIDFSWNAPAYCPSSAQVAGRAREGLGDLAERPLPQVRVRGDVTPGEGEAKWRLGLRTQGPRGDGERTLEADSCEQLADAAALVLVLLVRAEVERSAAPPPRDEAPPANEAAARDEVPLRGAVRIGALVDAGSLPEVAPGVSLAGALERGALRGEASGVVFFPRRQEEGPRSGTGGDVGLVAGGLRACYRPFRPFAGGWLVDGCAGAEIGYLRGKGFGLSNVESGGGVWSALLAGAWVSAPLGEAPFALRVGGEGGRTLASPHFEIDGYGRVFEPSPWFARFGLGLEWRTP